MRLFNRDSGTPALPDVIRMRLADMINGTKRQGETGGRLSTTVSYMKPGTAEYFYLTSGYIHRAINTRVNGLLRNGFIVTTEKSSDQDTLDEFIQSLPLNSIIASWVRNTEIYGNGYLEPFDGKDGIDIVEIPPSEMKYKENTDGTIMYKDGKPEGYEQWRDGQVIADWDFEEIMHLKFITIGASDMGVSSIQAALHPATQAGIIRSTSAEAFNRALNVIHVQVEGGTADDILEVSDALSGDFTKQSAYVTNERYDISSVGNSSGSLDIAQYIEPNVAEIAAAYEMPIELISATSTLRIDEFAARYSEWMASLKVRQQILADALSKQLFERIVDSPVEVTFNDPAPLNKPDFLQAIAFAKQSEALSQDQIARALTNSGVFDKSVFMEE